MIVINVTNGIEKSLKELKRKFNNTKTVKELRDRESFTSKSERRRQEIGKAKFKQSNKED